MWKELQLHGPSTRISRGAKVLQLTRSGPVIGYGHAVMSFFEGSVIKYTITHNIVIMLSKNPKSLNIEHNKKKNKKNYQSFGGEDNDVTN